MKTYIKLFSNNKGEIYRFLNLYFNKDNFLIKDSSILEWKKEFENPVEMAEIIGVFIDNFEDFKINLWICLDKDVLVNVTKNNANDIIKYLFERFPY